MKEDGIARVEGKILTIRGQRVILDADLAKLYGVSTSRFNEAVKRNNRRFPEDFAFQLESEEIAALMSQNAISKNPGRGGRRKLPWVFTEHGAVMAANVLNSPKAIEMSVFIVRAFVKMRESLSATRELARRLAEVEKQLLVHDTALIDLYEQIRPLLLPPSDPPKKQIGFHLREQPARYRTERKRK